MIYPPFSEILMVSQNVRRGGERQRGSTTKVLSSSNFGQKRKITLFIVEEKKSVLCPWQNTDFL